MTKTLSLPRNSQKAGKMPAPPSDPVHRGLTWRDMPGQKTKSITARKLTFAQFRRGQWPPVLWKIPKEAEGEHLKLLLEERLAMFLPKCRRGGGEEV